MDSRSHRGGFGGFRSTLWYAPESGIAIAFDVNVFSTNPNLLAARVMGTLLSYQNL